MTTVQYSETLQEALLRLEHTLKREKSLRKESEAILGGLSSLVGANSQQEVFSIMRHTFRNLIDCSDCWVMHEKNGLLVSSMTEFSFPIRKTFSRVLNGGALNAFDVQQIPEWQQAKVKHICSALHLPLQLSGSTGMLIIASEKPAAFSRDCVELVRRVIPFAEQANSKLELIKLSHIKELEQQRAQSDASMRKLSRAIEQAGESIMITDHKGTIEYVNPAFTTITGYTKEDALGKNPRILKSGNQTDEFYTDLWTTISKGQVWHSAVIDRRKDGSQYPALMTISPIFSDQGEITHFVGIQQDMTSHEALEEKFRQAQKMEALGTLVGGIAHDFNNMLAGMTGNLYLAKKMISGMPEVTQKLENVERLGFGAAKMIKQLLTFARKDTVKMKPFGLTSFIKEVTKLNEAGIPENISFHSNICNNELVIHGDATQLQQVIMNLLNNARDAVAMSNNPVICFDIEEYEADVQFHTAHPDMESSRFAHLTVSDNGSGISAADLEHVFEPFFTTKDVGQGTGLGLSMVYGAVKGHNGILEVKSEPQQGTAFHIYLPLLEEKVVDHVLKKSMPVLMGNGETILIVDDNADIRATSKEVLESIGYHVLEASDGLEAIEQFTISQNVLSLVIMDVVMPRLGGLQAVERIKLIKPDAKVIFSTGYDKDETLKSEMPSEGYVVLSKPYNITVLSKEIRLAIDS